ncbi:M20/M25/M40 family metallo-hydrolase [Propionicimonas sp.]|uniref:M20/M25/M40 family metallo-hydrolase n=1 Tax=Propionicimonas sp. TaxID=1955623 RepID=UPI0039E6E350
MTDPATVAALRATIADTMPQAIAELTDLVAIPSVSWPSFDQAEVRRSAEAISALASATGVFDEVGVYTAAIPGTSQTGQPAVLATRAARPGSRRVVLYAHHDVQPPGDEALWNSPPFVATERDGRLYGRGTGDDKAGVLTHLAALRALRTVVGEDLGGLGVTLFVEGEEEYGSRSFGQFLSDHAEALSGDLIVVADSGNWDSRTPGITVSLRGTAHFTLTVRTLAHALHSGMFGGAVPDAMLATIRLLSTLWDADGSVAVEGLRIRESATPAYDEARLREETDLPASTHPIGKGELLSRIWNQPSITVTGIDYASVATASNTLHPEVSVVISARVAPGQDAREAYAALRRHLEAHAPFGARLEFSDVDCGQGFLAEPGWVSGPARSALAEGFGVEPVDLGVGGSIPFIAELAREFPGAAILVTAVMDPQGSPHAPDESLHLATFEHAILSEAILLADLA